MRLAFLIGHFPPGVVGGAELQAEAWARVLADRHEITVVTRRAPATQPEVESRDGFHVVRLAVSRIPLWRTVQDVRGIGNAIERLKPQPDLLLCFQTFVSGVAGVRIQRRTGVPAVVWIRGEDEVRTGLMERARWIGPATWRAAAGVLTQSDRVRDALLQGLRSIRPAWADEVAAKSEVVPNGLALPEPPFRRGAGVLSVGRLIEAKGMDTVIEAATRAGLELTIAGDGPERGRLEALARTKGRVRFTGMASRDQLAELYRGAACVVLAARRGEGLPNVLLEAMSFARPVVATPVMGAADLVDDGRNGLLVPPDDPGALASALERIAGDDALAGCLGAEARRTAERFAWDRVRPRLEAALDRWRRP